MLISKKPTYYVNVHKCTDDMLIVCRIALPYHGWLRGGRAEIIEIAKIAEIHPIFNEECVLLLLFFLLSRLCFVISFSMNKYTLASEWDICNEYVDCFRSAKARNCVCPMWGNHTVDALLVYWNKNPIWFSATDVCINAYVQRSIKISIFFVFCSSFFFSILNFKMWVMDWIWHRS